MQNKKETKRKRKEKKKFTRWDLNPGPLDLSNTLIAGAAPNWV